MLSESLNAGCTLMVYVAMLHESVYLTKQDILLLSWTIYKHTLQASFSQGQGLIFASLSGNSWHWPLSSQLELVEGWLSDVIPRTQIKRPLRSVLMGKSGQLSLGRETAFSPFPQAGTQTSCPQCSHSFPSLLSRLPAALPPLQLWKHHRECRRGKRNTEFGPEIPPLW